MAERLSLKQRSELMSRVRAVDTKPEMVVRRLVYGMGYRYRIHRRDLPGKPDLVFPSKRKVIFVHGCFWHQHNCRRAARPVTNVEFWNDKLDRNVSRDRNNLRKLREIPWEPLIIWECEMADKEQLAARLSKFLERA